MALLHLQIDSPPPPPESGGSSKARGRLGTSRCGTVTARVLHQVSPAHSLQEHGSQRRPRPIIRGGNFSGCTASSGLDACGFHESGVFWFRRLFNFFSLRTHGPDNISTTLVGKRNTVTMAIAARAAGGLACTRSRQGRPRKNDRATPGPPGSPNPLGTSQTWHGRVWVRKQGDAIRSQCLGFV